MTDHPADCGLQFGDLLLSDARLKLEEDYEMLVVLNSYRSLLLPDVLDRHFEQL